MTSKKTPATPIADTAADPAREADAAVVVVADAQRVQQLNPRTLVMDANIRHQAQPSRALIASVRDHGVLETVQAAATGDGRARVRHGHRRTLAAIAAGLGDGAGNRAPRRRRRRADPGGRPTPRSMPRTPSGSRCPNPSSSTCSPGWGRWGDRRADRHADQGAAQAGGGCAARRHVHRGARGTGRARRGADADRGRVLAEFDSDPEGYEALLERAVAGYGFDHLAQRLRDAAPSRLPAPRSSTS